MATIASMVEAAKTGSMADQGQILSGEQQFQPGRKRPYISMMATQSSGQMQETLEVVRHSPMAKQ